MSLSHCGDGETGASYHIRNDDSLIYLCWSQGIMENKMNEVAIYIMRNEKVYEKWKSEEESEKNIRNHIAHHMHNT